MTVATTESRSTSDEKGAFLRAFFAALGESTLAWAVMRNAKGLPHTMAGNDLDLMVLPEELDAHRALLLSVATEQGWELVSAVEKANIRTYRVVSTTGDPARLPDVLMLDYFPGNSWFGARFAEAAEMLERRVLEGEVYCLAERDRVYCLVMHHLICTGNIGKEAYRGEIARVLESDADTFRSEVARRVGSGAADALVQRIEEVLQSGGHGDMPDLCKRFRRSATLRDLVARPLAAPLQWFSVANYEWQRIRRPMGLTIAIESELGPEAGAAFARDIAEWLWEIDRRNHAFVEDPAPGLVMCPHRYSRRRVLSDYGLLASNELPESQDPLDFASERFGTAALRGALDRRSKLIRLGIVALVQYAGEAPRLDPPADLCLCLCADAGPADPAAVRIEAGDEAVPMAARRIARALRENLDVRGWLR